MNTIICLNVRTHVTSDLCSSSSSCKHRLHLFWSITRKPSGVCAQITCQNTGVNMVEVLVVTPQKNRRLQKNKNCAVKTKVN